MTTTSISISPLHHAFAGEVSGLDITTAIDHADVAAIEAGMDAYAVLVVRDLAFTLYFGELEHYKSPGHIPKRDDHRLGPGIIDALVVYCMALPAAEAPGTSSNPPVLTS